MAEHLDGSERRGIHFVGSFPEGSTGEAMREMLEVGGGHGEYLRSVPNGERDRPGWMEKIVRSCEDFPELEVSGREGGGLPIFRVRSGAELTAGAVQAHLKRHGFGYAARATEGTAILNEIVGDAHSGPDYQYGVPSPLAFWYSVFGQNGDPDQLIPLRGATMLEVQEAQAAVKKLGRRAVGQFELPVETTLVAVTAMQTPDMLEAAARQQARLVLGMITELDTDPDFQFGLHLCVGDRDNEANLQLPTLDPLVELTNAFLEGMPAGRVPAYVHLPFAAGKQAAPADDRARYEPLSRIALDPGTRLIAGIAHEGSSLEDQARVLHWVEETMDRPVDVSAACGLGRRTLEAAHLVMDNMVMLARA